MSRLSNFSDINETFIVEPIGAIPSLTACTGVYTDAIISCSGNTQIFMGSGIITFDGSIYTSDNITASTINASTFYSGGTNIIDIINDSVVSITGGTFNDTTDTLTLYNNKGNTINVTGFTDYYTTGTTLIGKTVYFDRNDMLSAYTLNLNSFSTTDTFSTGLTFSDNQIIIARNDGVNLSTFVNTFTGLTINGTLGVTNILANTISGNTISATTFYGDGSNLTGISTQDTRIAEFTYSDNTFTITDSTGGTFNALFNAVTGLTVNGILSATTISGETFYGDGSKLTGISTQDTSISGFSYSDNSFTITDSTGGTFSALFDTVTGLTVNGNLSVTGDTSLQSLTANTLFANTYYNLPLDIRTTGATYDNNTFTYTNNTGETYSVLFDTVTGLTVNGILSATTISADTYYNLPKDVFVTGGTYSNGITEFVNNTGGTFSVSGFYTGATDVFVTGGTYSNGTSVFTNNTGGTFSVSGFSTAINFSGGSVTGLTATTISAATYLGLPLDIRVTGGTYSNGTAVFTNNTGGTFGVSGLTTPFTGGTVSGPTDFTNGLTANTFSLSTTPNTNTTNTNLLTLNQSTGVIEQRSINSLTNVVNLVTVGLSGSTGVDYNSVKLAVDSITGASATNTYVVKVGPGVFYENPITMKSYVDVIGESVTNTIIQANNPNTSLIIGADQSMISDVQIQGCTGTGVAAVIYSSATTPQLNAIFYVENVRFGTNYTHAKTVGTGGGNCIMQCSNVKYGGYPFTIGFYVTNDGSGIGRMQLRNVTSTNGGVATTTGLIFAKADKPGCAFIVNGCLLTKATGAAAGVGFWVEDGGSLRLTAVNFQRWLTGIYAPQTGSAPSIEAIALNFENCTTDVNIIHSGATGKIQGTDNYVKTLININAPLYEVNQDPRIISVAKKGGDFSSIKTAVDSITGSSINNRFLVSVGPGRFSEPLIDLTGKPYVSVQGSNIITTEVVPSTNTQHIFKIGQNNEISFLSLSGAPTGYAGIYAYDIGDYGQAHKLSFNDCDTNVWVESNTQDSIFFGEYLDFNGSYSYGTKVIANNGYEASAKMENYYNFPTGTETTIGNSVQGSGATLSVFVGDGISNGATGSTNYEVFDYGSLNTTTTTSDGWDYSVRNPNIGGPARFDIDSISIVNSIIYDISIEHPDTFGTFNGSAALSKVNVLSDEVYWSFLDIDSGEFNVTRKISVTFQDGTQTDASTLIFEGGTMGLIDGGVITHVSGLTVNISAGFGYLEKTVDVEIHARIDWDNTQITLSPDSENYLFFNENNILSSSGSLPDGTTNIILGRVVTNATGLRFIDVTPYNAKHTSNLLSTFNRNALGPIYSIGSTVTENVTPYHLNISAGDYYYSENNFKPSGGTDVNFVQYYRDGISGWITTGTTEVVNGYDDNSGFIASLPLSSFTKHALYVVGEGVNEEYMLVLGQTYYTSLVVAEGADLPTPPPYFDDGVTTIATILIQQGMSGITEIQDIRPVIGFKAAGVSASAVHGNLLGLTADDHKQYLLVDGVRAMTNNLSMGGNAIVSALTVNNVVVESHASRHKNGGADEIATATPAPSEIPKADTFGKLDGWISNASTSVKGLTSLSSSPVSATNPIAVGVTDSRFLSSISGISQSSNTLTLINNSGGTLSYTPNAATGGTYNNGTITLLGSGTLSTITGLSSLTPTTLYTGDGVLSGNRTLTLSGNNLSFVGSAHTNSFTSAGRLLLGTTTESTFLLDVSGTARVQGAITYRGDLIPANVPNQYCIGLLQGAGGSILRTYTNNGASPIQQFEFGFYSTSLNSSSGLSNPAANNFSFRIYGTHIATGIGGGTYTDFRISPTYNFVGNTNPGTVYGINYEPVLTNITNTTIVAFRNTVGNNWFNSTGGNTLIGTTTDAGFKLDVSGTARVSGDIRTQNGTTTTDLVANPTSGRILGALIPATFSLQMYMNRTSVYGGTGVHLANGELASGTITNYHNLNIADLFSNAVSTRTLSVRGLEAAATTDKRFSITTDGAGQNQGFQLFNDAGGWGNIATFGISSKAGHSIRDFDFRMNAADLDGGNLIYRAFGVSTNVGFGSTTDIPSATVHISSTTKGLLIPRMTLTQRNAIASPAAGLQVIVTGETGGEFVSMYNSSTASWVSSQQSLTLTTTGTSGSSTLVWATLNIPTYTLAGLGGQVALSGTGFVKISGTSISYDNSSYYLASNPSAFITLASLSGGTGISYNNATGLIASTITQYTDALARAAISLTTTGTSGASTYNSTTGVLNIPQYIGGVTSVFGRAGAVVAQEGDYSLTQLNDVTLTTPTTGQVLKYNGATWVNDIDANTGTVTSVGLSAPTGFSVTNSPVISSGTLTLAFASGYSLPTNASQTNWDTAYTNRITSLTTTGSSGSATLVSNTLNIPTYTLTGLGGQPLATNLTSLAGLTFASNSFVKMTSAGTFALDTNIYYLASNPSGFTSNAGTVTSVAALTLGTSGTDLNSTVANGTTTPVITLNVPTASATNRGALSSTDWTTFNGKFTLPSLTSGSVLFSNGTTIAQDNSNFFWDNANKWLGISATVINNLLSVGYNVFNNLPLASIGFNPTSGNVASTNGYLSLINIVAADPTSGISTGAMLGFNSSATNFYGQGLGALRNSKFDIWFQTGAINGGGYRFYTGTQENVTIFDNGNMLLQSGGTKTNAGFKLDVNGTARVTGDFTNSGSYIQVPGTNGLQIGFNDGTNTPTTKSNIAITNSGSGGVGFPQAFPVMTGRRNIFLVGTDNPSAVGSPAISGSDNLILGKASIGSLSGNFNTLIYSRGAISSGSGNTGLGNNALNGIATGSNNLHLTIGAGPGNGSFTSSLSNTVFIGDPSRANNNATVSGDIVITTPNFSSTQFWMGGKSDGSDIFFNIPVKTGTNQTGWDTYKRAGIGTGTGQPGKIIFQHSTPVASGTTIHSAFTNTLTLERTSISTASGVSLSVGGTANASAALNVESTTQGVLFPRMTTVQRDAIATPATGLQVYNTTTNTNNLYNGTAWVAIQNALTNPVTGTGTTNYLPKFTGASTIGNSNLINDASGNLGLAVTPSAWGNFFQAIEGNYGTSFTFDNNIPIAHIASNCFNNNTNWIYKINAPAARYEVVGWTGAHRWHTAPTGTAGNPITFTEAMTLNSSGSLLLGTTTDVPSAILNISSTTKGILIPRMTTVQKNAIATPAAGLQVYDTSTNSLEFYNGTVWQSLSGGGGGGITTLSTIGSSPNANGATITGTTLNLQPASINFGGVVTTSAQTFAGIKTFDSFLLIPNSGLQAGPNSELGNLFVRSADAFGQTNTNLLIGGASTTSVRISSRGATTTIASNSSYASFLLGAQGYTEAASGVHPIAAQLAIKPLVITNGVATTTNSATLYIEGETTGATNNYAVWINSGSTRFDGPLLPNNLAGTSGQVLTSQGLGVAPIWTTVSGGGSAYVVTGVSTTYTETATSGTKIIKANTTGGAFTITLPTAVGNTATIIIKKTAGVPSLTVDGAGTETIDDGLTAVINRVYESITLVSDNINWLII